MPIEKEILVYASLPYKKFRWVSYISLIQVGFVGVNFLLLPNSNFAEERSKAINKQKQDDHISTDITVKEPKQGIISRLFDINSYKDIISFKTTVDNIKESPILATIALTTTSLIISGLFFYTRRSIHTITLLPNEKVKFQLFSPFAIKNPPTIELPLRNVSCKATRHSKQNYSILKLRGYRGYHLVHKFEGHFLEPKLYDKYLGYERSWAK